MPVGNELLSFFGIARLLLDRFEHESVRRFSCALFDRRDTLFNPAEVSRVVGTEAMLRMYRVSITMVLPRT
ncbi:MAG: hypothetical protein ACR2FI_10805 [Burkholderiales bacterium]